MDDKAFLLGRLNDLANECEKKGYLTHTYFLNEAEQTLIKEILNGSSTYHGVTVTFYGGYPDAERKALYFLPFYMDESAFLVEEEENPTISALTILPKNDAFGEDDLTHRDYLGALMSLGIERERIGDIETNGKQANVLLFDENLVMVLDDLKSVKHTPIKLRKEKPSSLSWKKRYEVRVGSLSSFRLDSLIAEAFDQSRERAKGYILGGYVQHNGLEANDPSKTVKEGDTVSLRGKGKIKFIGEKKMSRRGRLIVEYWIYR